MRGVFLDITHTNTNANHQLSLISSLNLWNSDHAFWKIKLLWKNYEVVSNLFTYSLFLVELI